METEIRKEILSSLQFNMDKFRTCIFVNTNKTKSTMKITDVTFTGKQKRDTIQYKTFEDFKIDIMEICNSITNVQYKKTVVKGRGEYWSVFVYFNTKISNVKFTQGYKLIDGHWTQNY